MSITFIKQDLIKVDEIFNCNGHVILHVGNCKGVMNLGLAKQIRSKWPQIYRDYKEEKELILGNVVISNITENLTIYTLLAQDTYGYTGLHLNYVALKFCLNKIIETEKSRSNIENIPFRKIYLPFGLGCGLAGGNWQEVKTIIEETVSPLFDVFICSI